MVFLGDSLTEGGDWNEFFPELRTRTAASAETRWPALADGEGALRKELTRDHLHLTEPGYLAWVEVLAPHLAGCEALGGRPSNSPA